MRTLRVLAAVLSTLFLAPFSRSQESDARLKETLATLQRSIDTTVTTKNGDGLKTTLRTMRIPNPQSWFTNTFSDTTGITLAALYPEICGLNEDVFTEYFSTNAPVRGRLIAEVASG